jgi:Zinc finger, C3HC4 type (RING finger)
LINKLRRLSIKGSRNLALMSFFMALFGTMFIRRMVRVAKEYALKIERQKELRSQDKLHKVSELMTEDFKCIFCRRIAKNLIVKPCMHMFCCQGCYPKKVASGGCAVCGKTIEDKVNIYVV